MWTNGPEACCEWTWTNKWYKRFILWSEISVYAHKYSNGGNTKNVGNNFLQLQPEFAEMNQAEQSGNQTTIKSRILIQKAYYPFFFFLMAESHSNCVFDYTF